MRELRTDPGARLKTLRLYTDGAARGNPGPAGAGVVIKDDQGMPLRRLHRWLGKATNNEAEYLALIDGLKAASEWKPDRLEVYLDSKLVVEQLKGGYRVKKPELKPLYEEAKKLLGTFEDSPAINHVKREHNKDADALANQAIDEHLKRAKKGSASRG